MIDMSTMVTALFDWVMVYITSYICVFKEINSFVTRMVPFFLRLVYAWFFATFRTFQKKIVLNISNDYHLVLLKKIQLDLQMFIVRIPMVFTFQIQVLNMETSLQQFVVSTLHVVKYSKSFQFLGVISSFLSTSFTTEVYCTGFSGA